MTALVTGATGLVGAALVAQLDRPHLLARSVEKAAARFPDARVFPWDAASGPPPAAAFDGVDRVFHLAGDPVMAERWSDAKKDRIRQSRDEGTRHLVSTMRALTAPPKVLVSASAMGFYGDCGDQLLSEDAPAGVDFLARVCHAWEDAARGATDVGVRVVRMRISLVLAKQGGAFPPLRRLFRLGLGGPLANGAHWVSWIHLHDLVRLIRHAADDPHLDGPVNAATPHPLRNRDFTKALGRAVNRPALLPAPKFALQLALGERATVLLGSQRLVPEVALGTGFQFDFPRIEQALADLLADQA